MRGRDPWESLGVGGRIILTWILKVKYVKFWTGLV
jgi:hypothetical protein